MISRWDSDVFEGDLSDSIVSDLKSKLKYISHPYSGWRAIPLQKYSTVAINKHGLRNEEIKNYKRKNILLLGGSLAWGFGASSNLKTPAKLLQLKINKHFKKQKFNVINFADQGFTSHEEINTLVNVYQELNPCLIIYLTGVNDIKKIYMKKYWVSDIYLENFDKNIIFSRLGLLGEKSKLRFLAKFLKYPFLGKTEEKLRNNFFKLNCEYLDKNKLSIVEKKIICSLAIIKDIKCKVFYMNQPTLYKKNKKSLSESMIAKESSLSERKYNKFYNSYVSKIKRMILSKTKFEKKFEYFDLSNSFKNNEKSFFFDSVHVSDFGNEVISDNILSILKKKL